jgi:anaerobic magnesium-protoporphyrin IX monomethyl ester cyclase
MKIYFVRPNNPSALAIIPPLNIGYLSSAVKDIATPVLIDALRDNLTPIQSWENIESGSYVAITCLTTDYPWVLRFMKEKRADCTIILGGAHPTVLPEETLDETGVDYLVVGEGEIALREILEDKHSKGIVHGELVDVDMYIPDWDLIAPKKYPHKPQGVATKKKPVAPIMSSRGCPYGCSFCASPMISKRKILYRNPESVIKEMRLLRDVYGVKEFNLIDDNFTADKEHAMAVCLGVVNDGFTWTCENGIRADRVDDELLRTMKRAGCYRVAFGVESPNPEVLKLCHKAETVEQIEKSISLAKKVGFIVRGCFIIGLPGETKATLHNTAVWARKSKLDEANFTMLDILPGSELWLNLSGQFVPDWNKKSFKTPEYTPEGLTKQDLIDAQREAFRKFYIHPRRIFNFVKKLRPSQIGNVIQRMKDYHVV